MNYLKNYNDFALYVKELVKLGKRPKTQYEFSKNKNCWDHKEYEFHHIMPKSFGGSNTYDNLIPLTPREHYLMHYLLCKIYKNDNDKYYKMLNAFNRMSHCGKYNSKMYSYLRDEFRREHGKTVKGDKNKKARSVINLETLEVFDCINDAKAKYKINNISACCRNIINENKGTYWQYYDPTKSDEYYKELLKEKQQKSAINYNIRFKGAALCKKVKASTGETFDSINDALEWCKSGHIMDVINNKRKFAGKHPITKEKLRWELC